MRKIVILHVDLMERIATMEKIIKFIEESALIVSDILHREINFSLFTRDSIASSVKNIFLESTKRRTTANNVNGYSESMFA